ncbi:RsmB/NOP family class I SAM-dependent RNA methyltransferase [Piscirickettsia litoralis]|uniref:SAM-dependent MTase RsmB/NOP-type domain-containing protein n=1 Tax=Piscirickettsia litoralis TaxID=1891921 RepID=A0ABX3A2L8_9GAMM|nr:RsmB/NOP family class I SAM-dependent RNA methyltransferase [Piscirickettsia litoralis]ODN41695.1 hypothetical protein BGC07_00230 [Piscirickettsia litoralis]
MALSSSALSFLERYRPIIDDYDAFLSTLNTPLPLCLWSNDLRITSDDFATLLDEEQISYQRIPWMHNGFRILNQHSMGRHWSYIAGLCHIQEEISMLPPHILAPNHNDSVLDLCAAPGGKTLQMAIRMQNNGSVLANDIHHQRIRALSSHAQRLGLTNITSMINNASHIPSSLNDFDRILADVPCSCEGTSRKNPGVLQQLTVKKSQAQAKQQQAILRRAVQLCKPGGRILYSTCTYAPEENEAVLNAILQEYNNIHIIPINISGLKTTPALTYWQGQEYHSQMSNAIRIWPHHNNTGGFFIALIQKSTQHPSKPKADKSSPLENSIYTAQTLLSPQEQQNFLHGLNLRFGIEPEPLTQYHWHNQNQQAISLSSQASTPQLNNITNTGLAIIHTHGKYPKVTSAGALFLGPLAQKNKIEITTTQLAIYLKRQTINLDQNQYGNILPGAVFVTYKGYTLGLGQYRQQKNHSPQKDHQLESLLPKRWAQTSSA